MRLRLRLLETVVEVATEDPRAAELLALLWSEMADDGDGPPDRVYVVTRDDEGRWTATAGGAVEAVHETLWGVTDALRFRMLEVCEERLVHYVSVHAAAVARGRDLVLLAGGSGAGKTTLTLALLDEGWTYLSDDLAPVSVETGRVHPFPKPLGVKDPRVWQAVRQAFPHLPLGPPQGSFLVPPSRWRVAREAMEPRALVFPTYVPGAALEAEELSPGRAAALASAYLRRVDPSSIALLKRLCTGTSSVRLTYGSSADAVAAVGDLLDRRE